MLDLAVVAEQAGAVLAGPSLVTAARAAVLLADDPELLAALADGSTGFAVLDGDGAGDGRRGGRQLPGAARTAPWCSAPARSPPGSRWTPPAGSARCG